MIWTGKIKQLFNNYGLIFDNYPPTEDELSQLNSAQLKSYRDLKNMIETAFEAGKATEIAKNKAEKAE